MYELLTKRFEVKPFKTKLTDTVKPGYNALEGTGPQKRYRRESVIRRKRVSGITKRDISIATFNDNPRTKG